MCATILKNEFKKLVDYCSNAVPKLYIGTGNPKARILIIGKECAHNFGSEQISLDTLIKAEKIETENSNIQQWVNILNDKHVDISKITDCVTKNDNGIYQCDIFKYDARFPYKGQLIKRNKSENGGTSDTWLNYQKLIRTICPSDSNIVDFHEDCFITELNQIPSPNSRILDKQDIKDYVKSRVEYRKKMMIDNKEFFQSFSIIIIAAGNYPEKFDINLPEIFNVKKDDSKLFDTSHRLKIYSSEERIVIDTRQLSNIIPKKGDTIDNFYQNIANICLPYYVR